MIKKTPKSISKQSLYPQEVQNMNIQTSDIQSIQQNQEGYIASSGFMISPHSMKYLRHEIDYKSVSNLKSSLVSIGSTNFNSNPNFIKQQYNDGNELQSEFNDQQLQDQAILTLKDIVVNRDNQARHLNTKQVYVKTAKRRQLQVKLQSPFEASMKKKSPQAPEIPKFATFKMLPDLL